MNRILGYNWKGKQTPEFFKSIGLWYIHDMKVLARKKGHYFADLLSDEPVAVPI